MKPQEIAKPLVEILVENKLRGETQSHPKKVSFRPVTG